MMRKRIVNVGFTTRTAALHERTAQTTQKRRLGRASDLKFDSDSDGSSISSLSSLSSLSDNDSGDDLHSSSDDDSDDDDSDDQSTVPTSDDDYQDDMSDDEDGRATATKRKRRGIYTSTHPTTPRKRRRHRLDDDSTPTKNTPRSKAHILGDVSRAPTVLPARPDRLDVLPSDELARLSIRTRAKRLLHVGATPESLPCRQEQFDEVLACLEDAVQDGLGGCIYVSGVPGTGKTATVREVIRSLQRRAANDEIRPFQFCEINGMKLQDAQDTYGVLWHALTGMRCSNSVALRLLAQRFSGGGAAPSSSSSSTSTTVVLMDELDQLVTARQDVMYNMFNWPNGAHSRLVVVAVANTMDLPERVLHAKVASRLGMTRITFRPYSDRQLVEIVHARLGVTSSRATSTNEPGRLANAALSHTHGCDTVFAPEALVYLAKRVANVSGDARRMLDVCRRAIDAVEETRQRSSTAQMPTVDIDPSVSITISDMKRVLDAMVKSGKAAHIIHLPLQAKLALVAVLLSVRRAGKAEVDLGTITATHISLARMHALPLPTTEDDDLGRLASMANLVGQLCALGLVIAVGSGVASARSGRFARYILAVGEDDARLAFDQDDDSRLRGLL